MRRKKLFLWGALAFIIIVFSSFAAAAAFIHASHVTKKDLAKFHDGYIVFQTSTSDQSFAVGLASGSPYTHMGIVKETMRGKYVIEAVTPVRETPLQEWIERGWRGRVTVMRYEGNNPKNPKKIVQNVKPYYGQPYDPYFMFDNGKLYCSELVYLAYKHSGIELGKIQKVKDLFVNNYAVEKMFKSRWKSHPVCKNLKTANECWGVVLEQELITPKSIANDPALALVYTNYTPNIEQYLEGLFLADSR